MKQQNGFTLVEVLIAAVILFAALSMSAMTLQTLRNSSAKAEAVIRTLQPARMIALSIREKIRSQPQMTMSGEGKVADVSYQWQANTIKTGSAPVQFDADTGEFTTQPERYLLYLVDVQLITAGRTEQLQFKELAWLPLDI